MDRLDQRIINTLQGGFPVAERPYAQVAADLGLSEGDLIARLAALLASGVLSRFGPLYDAEKMGGGLTLAAMEVPAARFDAVAEIVNGFPEVAHNYAREHRINMWFVVATEDPGRVPAVLDEIAGATGLPVLDMPKQEEYFLRLRLTA